MIMYNVSVKIDHEIEEDWLDWMKEIHLPAVMSTGCFLDNKMYKLLVDETDGLTYIIQYLCTDLDKLNYYQAEFGPELRNETERLFSGKYVSFRTVMELL